MDLFINGNYLTDTFSRVVCENTATHSVQLWLDGTKRLLEGSSSKAISAAQVLILVFTYVLKNCKNPTCAFTCL